MDALFTIASDVLAVVFGDDEENIRFSRGKEGQKTERMKMRSRRIELLF